jgi:hypothetical protein
MRILLSFPLLLVGVSLTFNQPRSGMAKAGPCSCDDRAHLLNRLDQVDAAISAYEIAETEGRGKLLSSAGKVLAGNVADLEIRVAAAMRQVSQQGGAGKIQGEVGAFDCRNELSGQTACLAEIARRHQAVRQLQCEKRTAQRAAGTAITLSDFAEDEIKAYQAERKYILSVLDALTLCKPRSWFGTVTYTLTTKYSAEDKRTYGLKNENDSNSFTDRTTVASGMIRFGDLNAEQRETVTYSQETAGVDHLQRQCIGTGQKGYVTETTTLKTKEEGSAEATKSLALKVNEAANQQATLSFNSLSFTVQTKKTSDFHQTGCKEKTEPGSFDGKVTVAGEGFKLGGQLSSDGLTFSGSQSNKRTGLVAGNIKVNNSVLTATWTLHRLSR